MFIQAEVYQGEPRNIEIDKFPDYCPICHYSLEPRRQGLGHFNESKGLGGALEIVFQCPRERCQSFFIARYGTRYGIQRLSECVPFEPTDMEYPENIRTISPDFCAIANEAEKAEGQHWKLVAGPGYRKALEFLIKDYLCRLRPADAEKIKTAQLGPCIANYVENEKVKTTASRAAWLGNDETHYLRKWEDKDLEDLKKLIALTVHWIEMEELTDSVLKDMPEGKKKK